MDGATNTQARAPMRRRRVVLVGAVAAAVGFLGGAAMMASGPAGANVDTWHAVTFETGYADVETGQGFQPTEYGVDGEDFVHLRGAIKAEDAVVERAGGLIGPWMSVAFELPCGARPQARVIQPIAATNLGINVSYQGLIRIEPTGEVYLGSFDMPVDVDQNTQVATADYFTSLDSVSFELDDEVCPSETTTTTEG